MHVVFFFLVDLGGGSSSFRYHDRGKTKSTPCLFDFEWTFGLG